MPKNVIVTLSTVACVLQLSGPLRADEPQRVPELTVQTDNKADSRLVVEIPEMVQTWTDQCTDKEKAEDADALHCWRAAAAVADEYASGFSGPLAEQVRRLQVAWLQRASQLQSTRLSSAENEPRIAASVRPVRKKLSADTLRRARKVLAAPGSNEAAPAAKQRKKTIAAGKRPQKTVRLAKARDVKVVPADYVSRDTRPGSQAAARAGDAPRKAEMRAIREELDGIAGRIAAKAGDVTVVPAGYVLRDTRPGSRAAARAGDAPRNAEMRAIREELDRIAGRIDCLSRNCAKGEKVH